VFAPKFWPCAHLITTFTIGGGTKSVKDVRSEVIKSYITRSGIESALSAACETRRQAASRSKLQPRKPTRNGRHLWITCGRRLW
jgi:hypothetical protein